MPHLMGLDIGTTGCKACLFDDHGNLVARAAREYTVDISHVGWAEQDAEAVWVFAQQVIGEVLARAATNRVVAIGLSVQGEAVIPVDRQGQALRAAILGMDTRTDEQNGWLLERFGSEHLFQITGMPVHTINTLPKLLWLKRYEPDLWAVADRFLLYEDFLVCKMTGEPAISHCLASRTQLYDLRGRDWSTEILDAVELDPHRLAPVSHSGSAVGHMLPILAEHLGLEKPPLIVLGGHDQACAALGAGLTAPGVAMVSTGTAEVVEACLGSPILSAELYGGNISVYAHVIPELYLAMTLNHSGGLLLRWFRDTIGVPEVQLAQATGRDAYDLILADASSGPTDLLVLPHFAGSGTPWFDADSRGAILGLTFATKRATLAKAILEGLTYELRINLDLLQAGGVALQELHAVGGGARSKLWLQLKADICRIPVAVPKVTEAACLGASLLAGWAAGIYPDPGSAASQIVCTEQHIIPQPAMTHVYEQRFAIYRQTYPALAKLHHQLSALE